MAIVEFQTNIDAAKRFMRQNSGLSVQGINPLIGDSVMVYHDTDFEVWMRVIDRNWRLTNESIPVLICHLGLPDGFATIPDFTNMLRRRGF